MVEGYPAEISCVISNKEGVYGLKRAKDHGISAHVVSHKELSQEEFEHQIHKIFIEAGVELICLAGFMRILSADFIQKWDGKILNIHPALLPKFGGKGMYGMHVHRAVIEAEEVESGASVHIVTAGCDEGPVILQKSVRVLEGDTPEDLAARVLAVEHEIYPEAVKQFCQRTG